MIDNVQWLAVAVAAVLFLVVLELVRRRLLAEEYSLVWLAGAAGLLFLAVHRESLHTIARWLGVFYPPAVLLLMVVLFTFVAGLAFSVALSRERARVERLAEDVALLSAEVRELSQKLRGEAP